MSDSLHSMDCSPSGSSVQGILQASMLEWVAMPSSRESSQPRDWIQIFCITGRFFAPEPSRKSFLQRCLVVFRADGLEYKVQEDLICVWQLKVNSWKAGLWGGSRYLTPGNGSFLKVSWGYSQTPTFTKATPNPHLPTSPHSSCYWQTHGHPCPRQHQGHRKEALFPLFFPLKVWTPPFLLPLPALEEKALKAGKTDAEAETPVLWPPDAKNWLIWKDPDAGKDWRWTKGTTEDEMVGWPHRLDGLEFG